MKKILLSFLASLPLLCILVSCGPIIDWRGRIGPESIPDLMSEKYYYKTYSADKSIEQLQMNLTAYALRCDYGLNNTWRTFQKSSPTEAIIIAENGLIYMFGAHAKEDGAQTSVALYTWADKEIAEHFLIALENGQCITSYSDPVLLERMKK